MCLLPHHRLWWGSPCQGLHPCHSGGLRELQRAHTPLQRSAFEHELKKHPDKAWVSWLLQHPDKAWVSWLLNGIDNGVSTGYNGPHFPFTARNLHTTAPQNCECQTREGGELGTHPLPLFPMPPQAPPHIRAQSCPKEKWQVESDPSLVSTRGS